MEAVPKSQWCIGYQSEFMLQFSKGVLTCPAGSEARVRKLQRGTAWTKQWWPTNSERFPLGGGSRVCPITIIPQLTTST
eukprot:6462764-Amphidinium_carterae.2